jgi:hypothetical protein
MRRFWFRTRLFEHEEEHDFWLRLRRENESKFVSILRDDSVVPVGEAALPAGLRGTESIGPKVQLTQELPA